MPYTEEALPGFTFGCDPELFVVNDKGIAVTAEGLIPGTKEDPYKVPGGAVQVDGMAAEFNIDAVTNFNDFNKNIRNVMTHLRGMLPEGYTLLNAPSMVFGQDVWDSTPEKAKELGCSPDFNAWTGDVNPVPNCESSPRLRTASGHLHIGWTEDEDMSDIEHIGNCRDLVKQLDWYLGGWSLRMDSDPTRRRLYGKAGACRYKSYGVEYRVLSNFWVDNVDSRRAVWNRMVRAVTDMRTNFMPEKNSNSHYLIESINSSQRNIALEKAYRFPLTSLEL